MLINQFKNFLSTEILYNYKKYATILWQATISHVDQSIAPNTPA